MRTMGKHFLLDLKECNKDLLDDVDTHGRSPWHSNFQASLDALRANTHSPTGIARGTLPFGLLEFIKDVLHTVTKDAGNAVIGESFHRFLPQGISGVVLITGAHLCIHTWPEYGYSAIDVFTYGDLFQPEEAARLIMEKLESKNPSIVELKRGF